MNLEEFRSIVQSQMPYDTGFMFLAGAKYFDTEHFRLAVYDTERVPYIIYNEEGTVYSTKNKGFISQRTIGALNRYAVSGDKQVMSQFEEYNNRRGSTNMIRQGALEKISTEPEWVSDSDRLRGLVK
jgi:hypothetical protein